MYIGYEFTNAKLKEIVEKKAELLGISVDRLIWNYINRGLMGDYWTEDSMKKFHSQEYLNEIDDALGIEWNILMLLLRKS